METGWLCAFPLAFAARDCKEKLRTPSKRGFDPDFSAGPFDDPLADGKAHTGAGIGCGAVKTLEDFKDLLLVLWVNADAVVADGKQPLLVPPLCCDMNPRGASPLR
jgi:hypothetical protein